MRPILLKGHERPITQLLYNRQGDLLFSAAKSPQPCVWYADNGERIGTYKGHNGSVWSLDVDFDTRRLITGSADNTIKLWDVQSGKELYTWKVRAPVRFVNFDEGDKRFLAVTDAVMGMKAQVCIYNLSQDSSAQEPDPEKVVVIDNKVLQAWWTPLNKSIICACKDGSVRVIDPETATETKKVQLHEKTCQSINFSPDRSHFITASLDHKCHIVDTRTLEVIKTFDSGRPVNASAMSTLLPHIILGGGQSAESVTTTRLDSSQFKVRFFHKIYEDEIAAVQGHFGPVNALQFHPSGKSFVSGGEDGYIRMHWFDDNYFEGLSDRALFGEKVEELYM